MFAFNQRRQKALLLFIRTEHHNRVRAKQINVNGAGRLKATAIPGHLMHHQRRFGDAQARAAIFFRHGDA